MKTESAVQFETDSRIHIALAVNDLEKTIAFYRVLFGQEPTKTRSGYAKFEIPSRPSTSPSTRSVEPPARTTRSPTSASR